MINTKELIKMLSESACIGHNRQALDVAREYLEPLAEVHELHKNSLSALIKGESDKTVAVEAHIDEIGFTVTHIDERGFLKVATAGGFDLRCLPSHRVSVLGRETVDAVFTSIPPHLSKKEAEFSDIGDLSLDTGLLGKAKDIISVGDFAVYKKDCISLCGDRMTGKALDNRAGVATLLLLADMFCDKKPPVNLLILLCNEEELGTRGVGTAAFGCEIDEAVAVDVSFGDFPSARPDECGKLGGGPMIGLSPILSKPVCDALLKAAENAGIPYQKEVMGSRTGTDADALSVSKSGIPTGLVSIPLRNMHTDAEVISIGDVENAAKLLYNYVSAGGGLRD